MCLCALCSVAVTIAPRASAAVAHKKAPYTVVAVIDSGIDPYHLDFRRHGLTPHPSTYIEKFPTGAKPLQLSLDAPTYGAALAADERVWRSVKENQLYWIPGTNIIGAIGPFDSTAALGPEDDAGLPGQVPPFFDEIGHGTAVASLAGGMSHGPEGNQTLLVVIRGFEDGLDWAARQPWIDVITNSWWNLQLDDYAKAAKASRLATDRGKVVCFASGNFAHPQLYTGTQGPSWTVNVGAASERTRGEHAYSNYPNDVLGLSALPAAEAGTFEGEREFGGTSAATPNVCGLMAQTITKMRAKVGTAHQGPRRGALVFGRKAKGSLEDGGVTRQELEDAIQSTAVPAATSMPDPEDPYAIPALPAAGFLRGGYGIVDRDSARSAWEVLIGATPRPTRSVEDAWIGAVDSVRDLIWTNVP